MSESKQIITIFDEIFQIFDEGLGLDYDNLDADVIPTYDYDYEYSDYDYEYFQHRDYRDYCYGK